MNTWLFFVVAFIHGTVGRHRRVIQTTNFGSSQCDSNDCSIYTFAFNDVRPRAIDNNGALDGSRVQLMHKVCNWAHKRCKGVLATFEQCFDYRTGTSQILDNKKYDACVEVPTTAIETKSYKASEYPFFDIPYLQGYVRKGSSLTEEDFKQDGNDYSIVYDKTHDVPTGKIVESLKKLGYKVANAKPVDMHEELNLEAEYVVNLIEQGQADLGILHPLLADTSRVDSIMTLNNFHRGHVGVLVRKDSNLLDWWDGAIKGFICSNQYKQYCSDMINQYGEKFKELYCVAPQTRKEWCGYE